MANPHPEPHPENLRPIPKGSTEIQRKGGKAAARKAAQRRTMREWAEVYGQLPLHKGVVKDPKNAEEVGSSNPTMDGAVIIAMYKKAAKGDVRAAEFLAKLKGQTSEDLVVHIDRMAEMDTEDLLKLYEGTKEGED